MYCKLQRNSIDVYPKSKHSHDIMGVNIHSKWLLYYNYHLQAFEIIKGEYLLNASIKNPDVVCVTANTKRSSIIILYSWFIRKNCVIATAGEFK